MDNPQISAEDFEYFRRAVEERSGISLSHAKVHLVESRLRRRIYDLGLDGFHKYRRLLESLPEDDPEWQMFLNEITTNKTEFFREPHHFDYLAVDYLHAWLEANKSRELLVWSSACSTGEEPYTAAMCLKKFMPYGRQFHIFGTDIDTEVLHIAQNGVYHRASLDEVPVDYQSFGFDMGQRRLTDWIRVSRAVKERVTFDRLNLQDIPYPWTKKFDVIFCRNVLIYFSPKVVQQVTEALYESCRPGGVLFIGHSEALQNMNTPWKYIAPSIYKKEK